METSEEPTFPGFEEESLFYPLACPASRPPWPGSDEAQAMTVGSGTQCSMLLDQSSPLGAFSRILLGSSLWTSSAEFSYVWNRLDTRFACSAFQLTPLGQGTGESGCSLLGTPNAREAGPNGQVGCLRETIQRLWRTPNASDGDRGGMDGQKRLENGHALNLNDQVLTPKLWPTPCAQEDDKSPEAHLAMKARMKGGPRKTVTSLTVAAKLWPTPRNDHSGLESHGVTALGGSLNPRFVEELMGFRIDHTALKRSATPSSRSKPTRSLQRSR